MRFTHPRNHQSSDLLATPIKLMSKMAVFGPKSDPFWKDRPHPTKLWDGPVSKSFKKFEKFWTFYRFLAKPQISPFFVKNVKFYSFDSKQTQKPKNLQQIDYFNESLCTPQTNVWSQKWATCAVFERFKKSILGQKMVPELRTVFWNRSKVFTLKVRLFRFFHQLLSTLKFQISVFRGLQKNLSEACSFYS